VNYFDRKNCYLPDDLADETLNRVARRLEEEGEISDTPPARYCYIVAKFVFLESLRTVDRKHVSLDEVTHREGVANLNSASINKSNESQDLKERRLACLEHCLHKLTPENRELLLQYYKGEQRTKIENRRAMAASLGITMNALTIRACRLRNALEECLRKFASA
jgi:DNA-directed RNA polymerase specialized sigma24 family protein